jgi:hypothetical protein
LFTAERWERKLKIFSASSAVCGEMLLENGIDFMKFYTRGLRVKGLRIKVKGERLKVEGERSKVKGQRIKAKGERKVLRAEDWGLSKGWGGERLKESAEDWGLRTEDWVKGGETEGGRKKKKVRGWEGGKVRGAGEEEHFVWGAAWRPWKERHKGEGKKPGSRRTVKGN